MRINVCFVGAVLASLLVAGGANAQTGPASESLTPIARSEVVRAWNAPTQPPLKRGKGRLYST